MPWGPPGIPADERPAAGAQAQAGSGTRHRNRPALADPVRRDQSI